MEHKSNYLVIYIYIYIISYALGPNLPFLRLPHKRKVVNRGWHLFCVFPQQEQNACCTLLWPFHWLQRDLDQTHKSLFTSVSYLKTLLENQVSSISIQFIGFTVFDWRKCSVIASGKISQQGVIVCLSLSARPGEKGLQAYAVVPREKLFTLLVCL